MGALAHSGRGEGRVRLWVDPVVKLHQPEAHRAFSQGSCPWIMGPSQWWAAHAPGREGVDSDLCLHTGFLVSAVATLASHFRHWCPR